MTGEQTKKEEEADGAFKDWSVRLMSRRRAGYPGLPSL